MESRLSEAENNTISIESRVSGEESVRASADTSLETKITNNITFKIIC